MQEQIYHIVPIDQWRQAEIKGKYEPAGYATDGFIHCSYLHQLIRVANYNFKGRTDMVVLNISRSKTECKVIDENLEGSQELFPHIYGILPIDAVCEVLGFPCNNDGNFSLQKHRQ